jgi:ABC-2 type transport system permease protein
MKAPPRPRQIGAVNWLGLRTLYVKEVHRFIKISGQTIAAPVITTLLFLAIFSLALGRGAAYVGGVGFTEFLAPGLVMMAIVQNAFGNTSSSIVISKIQGNIVDILMPPLGPVELTLGYALGGVTRGLLVGLVTALAMLAFVPFQLHQPFHIVFHAIAASLMLSLLGIIGGVWAQRYEHVAAATNFVVTPLSFLSGTFYSIERLPDALRAIALFNPFFYLIDGFRFGFTGHADADLPTGFAVVTGVNVVLWLVCWQMFRVGYRLKA